MKTLSQTIAVLLFLSVGPCVTWASLETKNEVVLSTTNAGISATSRAHDTSQDWDVAAEYHRALNGWFQVGGRASAYYSNDSSYSSWEGEPLVDSRSTSGYSLSLGPTFNVSVNDRGMTGAFYLRPFIGAGRSYSLDELKTEMIKRSRSYTNYFGRIELGKRFEIVENLTFSPNLYIRVDESYMDGSQYSTGAVYSYGIQVLKLSYFW